AAAPIGPFARGGLGVIERVVRFARDHPDESQRGLAIAPRGKAKVDIRGLRMLRDHAAEHIVGDAADKAGANIQPRQTYGNVEARAAYNGPDRLTAIRSRD